MGPDDETYNTGDDDEANGYYEEEEQEEEEYGDQQQEYETRVDGGITGAMDSVDED